MCYFVGFNSRAFVLRRSATILFLQMSRNSRSYVGTIAARGFGFAGEPGMVEPDTPIIPGAECVSDAILRFWHDSHDLQINEQRCIATGCRALVAQLELPEYDESKGEEPFYHIQVFVSFKDPKSMGQVKEYFGCDWMHLEPARGTMKDCVAYCEKDDTFCDQLGHPRVSYFLMGRRHQLSMGQGYRSDIAVLTAMLQSGMTSMEIKKSNPTLWLQHNRMIQQWISTESTQKRPAPSVHYLFGKTGSGKTRRVLGLPAKMGWKNNGQPLSEDDVYHVMTDGGSHLWWDGYEGQRVCVFDDFKSSQVKVEELMKILSRAPLRVQIKGGTTILKAYVFLFTSILPVDEHYVGDPQRDSWLRRVRDEGTIYDCEKMSDPIEWADEEEVPMDIDFGTAFSDLVGSASNPIVLDD